MQADHLDSLIFSIASLLRRRFDRRIKPKNFTYMQARALIFLEGSQGCRQIDLANKLGLKPSSLGNMLDHLEINALIERKPAQSDRRAYRLLLAPESTAALPALKEAIGSTNEQALGHLSNSQIMLLIDMLEGINAKLATDSPER
ncbi:MarR family transcriptional regulator [Pseudomonas putida]|uniref:MarR family winged helix-turn-helix transcriptional regulator n=1 Tax=Pseudomonas putida TaxID=303 RepID=UPI002363D9F8|nr:MarR family transcriptional regulator [Pseudomonas putida]MDD2068722.1 MarR family transcriptional regulator [Pseudomonas putida]HDS1738655.1 MarR family transcriptional regulator [Pseudomonas putida]